MSVMGGLPGSGVVSDNGVVGWWLVDGGDDVPGRVLAGPFPDRAAAGWSGTALADGAAARPAYGVRRADGTLHRRPSPQEWAWLDHLTAQLDPAQLGDRLGLEVEPGRDGGRTVAEVAAVGRVRPAGEHE